MNHNFHHSNIENCNNIMALPSSIINDKTKTPINKNKPALTQSCVILPSQLLRKSLICNSLAQACSLKRALEDNTHSATVSSSSLSLQSSSSSQLCLKKSKSDSSMMAKFTYKHHHHRSTNPRAIKVISSSSTTMGHLLNEEWKNAFTADDLSSSSSSSSSYSSSSSTSSLYDLSHLSAGSAALALAVGGCNSSSNSSNNIVSITSSSTPSSSSSATTTPMQEDDTNDTNDMCPYTYMKTYFAAANDDDGLSSDNDDTDTTPTNPSWMQPLHETEFHPPTQEQIDAYTNDAVSAVRSSNLQTLRDIHTTHGPTYLKCCNRYGESLLHIACRRSTSAIVSFLLNEVNVSPNIKDDYGRTPLHDACWRGNPEYDIVELLLKKEPRLLWCKDVRGYLPLNYARREHWKGWNGFLDDRGRELLCMSSS